MASRCCFSSHATKKRMPGSFLLRSSKHNNNQHIATKYSKNQDCTYVVRAWRTSVSVRFPPKFHSKLEGRSVHLCPGNHHLIPCEQLLSPFNLLGVCWKNRPRFTKVVWAESWLTWRSCWAVTSPVRAQPREDPPSSR